MISITAVMWVVQFFNAAMGGALDFYGIHALWPSGLLGIVTAPFLHGSWEHLMSNSLPLLVLGWLTLLGGTRQWIRASLVIMVCSGLFAWTFSPPGSLTIGASGIVFGYLSYLLSRGLVTRRIRDILLAVIVFAVYGSVLWGVLPGQYGVSWQAHLGGALGGVLAATRLRR
ncbi:rhomboid family intramembrane serine protease [Propionibacterium cyclohexanicum]|nr:rhomboid family intramembrane serine protease [Propionibacterium cyclohexanicum]